MIEPYERYEFFFPQSASLAPRVGQRRKMTDDELGFEAVDCRLSIHRMTETGGKDA